MRTIDSLRTVFMKPIFFFLGFVLLATSCQHVYFTEPQPKGGTLLTEVPEELYGLWFDSDGLRIDAQGFTIINVKQDSLGNPKDTVYELMTLCDTFQLYKAKELYVINYKEVGKNWELYVLKPLKNGDIESYSSADPEIYAKDKGLKLLEATYTVEGEEKTVKTLYSEYDGSVEFQEATFSGKMKLRTLRKTLTPDHLDNILKADGTIYKPQDETEEE